jgi:hypothetical protein
MDESRARTLAIVNELAQGKQLFLPVGTLAMGADMSIGFVLEGSDGVEYVLGLSTMDLRELNMLLDEYNVGMVIPNLKLERKK